MKTTNGVLMKNDFEGTKQLANLYRRLASIRTEGSHRADRALIMLAARLEYDAAEVRVAAPAEPRKPVYVRRRP